MKGSDNPPKCGSREEKSAWDGSKLHVWALPEKKGLGCSPLIELSTFGESTTGFKIRLGWPNHTLILKDEYHISMSEEYGDETQVPTTLLGEEWNGANRFFRKTNGTLIETDIKKINRLQLKQKDKELFIGTRMPTNYIKKVGGFLINELHKLSIRGMKLK